MDFINYHWVAAINEYRLTGDIRPLAQLIRDKAIPEKYRPSIADILEGKFKRASARSEPARSALMRKRYDELLSQAKINRRFHDLFEPFNNSYLAHKLGFLKRKPKLKFGKKWIIKILADEFYRGAYDSARVVISRKIKKYDWPELPSE